MAQPNNSLYLVILTAALCLAQSVSTAEPTQTPEQTSPSQITAPASSAKGHGVMPVDLTKSLDSKKLKEGDAVTARIAADLRMKDGTDIPRGSKVTGHVTEAKSRSKGDSQSALGIIFDKISLPDGKEMAIKGEIQAVAPNPNSGTADSGGVNYPGMMPGHEGSGAGTTAPAAPSAPASQQSGRPLLNAQSKGVIGMHNLELGENSVLVSSGKNVSLDNGTQMMLQVEVE